MTPSARDSDARNAEKDSADQGSVDEGSADEEAAVEDARWLTINGRRWRRTDPSLPEEVVEALTSHLGRGRSGVRSAQRADDPVAVAAARTRVGLAKNGLGERGPYWWDEPEADRLARALDALRRLDALDERR